jgi:hypothetical protein
VHKLRLNADDAKPRAAQPKISPRITILPKDVMRAIHFR